MVMQQLQMEERQKKTRKSGQRDPKVSRERSSKKKEKIGCRPELVVTACSQTLVA